MWCHALFRVPIWFGTESILSFIRIQNLGPAWGDPAFCWLKLFAFSQISLGNGGSVARITSQGRSGILISEDRAGCFQRFQLKQLPNFIDQTPCPL